MTHPSFDCLARAAALKNHFHRFLLLIFVDFLFYLVFFFIPLLSQLCKNDYSIFSSLRPPPFLFLALHFLVEIWTEMLSKMMKKHNSLSHFHWLSNRYMQWISPFLIKCSILIAFHVKDGLNDSSSTVQRGR